MGNGKADRALVTTVLQRGGGGVGDSETVRWLGHLLYTGKQNHRNRRKTVSRQRTSVIKYVPSHGRQEAAKPLLCSLTMPGT